MNATVLSLGAGVQSSALLLMSDRGEIERADFAVFADTQSEPREVYDWLRFLASQVAIPIITATKGHLIRDTLDHERRRFASIPFFVKNRDGSRGISRRQCTKEYKIEPIQKAVRERLGYPKRARVKHQVRMLIGISCDEVYRMKPSRTKWITNVYPLVDAWRSREWARNYVTAAIARTPPRSACIVCPYRSDAEWMSLRQRSPEEFSEACDFDRAIRVQKKFSGQNFLHRSLRPLSDVVFSEGDKDQIDLFNNECEGLCGV